MELLREATALVVAPQPAYSSSIGHSTSAGQGEARAALLRALLALIASCAALNSANQEYVRDLGGVSLVGRMAVDAAAVLAQPPAPAPGPHDAHRLNGVNGVNGSSGSGSSCSTPVTWLAGPAEAALVAQGACAALSSLVRDSPANQDRLQVGQQLRNA